MPFFDAINFYSTQGSGGDSQVQITHVVADQPNRVAYWFAATDNNPDIHAEIESGTHLFGEEEMEYYGKTVISGQNIIVYRLIAPPVGSSIVDFSWSTVVGGIFGVLSAHDVNQTTPERGPLVPAGHAGSANPSVGVSSAIGDLLISILSLNNDDGIEEGVGQARVGEALLGYDGIAGLVVNTKAGANGTVLNTWAAASQRWGAVAFSLQPPGAAVAVKVISDIFQGTDSGAILANLTNIKFTVRSSPDTETSLWKSSTGSTDANGRFVINDPAAVAGALGSTISLSADVMISGNRYVETYILPIIDMNTLGG